METKVKKPFCPRVMDNAGETYKAVHKKSEFVYIICQLAACVLYTTHRIYVFFFYFFLFFRLFLFLSCIYTLHIVQPSLPPFANTFITKACARHDSAHTRAITLLTFDKRLLCVLWSLTLRNNELYAKKIYVFFFFFCNSTLVMYLDKYGQYEKKIFKKTRLNSLKHDVINFVI